MINKLIETLELMNKLKGFKKFTIDFEPEEVKALYKELAGLKAENKKLKIIKNNVEYYIYNNLFTNEEIKIIYDIKYIIENEDYKSTFNEVNNDILLERIDEE